MPGRQAHGRPLLASSGPGKPKKPKSKGNKSKALDAFALAREQVPERRSKGVRMRDMEPEPAGRNQKRRRRDEEDEDEDEDEDEEDGGGADLSRGPRKKRARNDGEDGEEFDELPDSDDEEWHIGVEGDDDDSEIDSDDAFGDDDDEYTLRRGGNSRGAPGGDDGDDTDADGESLGSDAVDLAQALDQASDDEELEGGSGSGSGSGSEGDGISDDSESEDEDESEDEEDPARRDQLKALISGFAGADEDQETNQSTSQREKIGLEDLGLTSVKDPHIRKSLKLMEREEKSDSRGAPKKKLDVPLARRQQDRLSRSAAYEKASETLDRWTDTVKHNRRAEHLFFPLAQNQHDAGLDNRDLLPLDQKASGTELEQTIMSIMEESGLGPSSKAKKKEEDKDGEGGEQSVSRAELKSLWNERRRERELHSREKARAKRIKKIKSKAYHRVHRKERLREETAAKEALAEAGEIDSDEEREAQDRRRAMERMGSKHKESKWAKMGSKNRRAVWDEDYRTGLTDMARMDAELRRRVEGKKGSDDDDDGSGSSADDGEDDGDDDGKRRLLKELDRASEEVPRPRSGLMGMKFMQRGEEAIKKANDELSKQLRRELASDGEEESAEDEEVDIGRRQYGTAKAMGASKSAKTTDVKDGDRLDFASGSIRPFSNDSRKLGDGFSIAASHQVEPEVQNSAPGAAGAWSRAGPERRKNKKASQRGKAEELDLSNAAMLATKREKPKDQKSSGVDEEDGSDDENEVHLPMTIKDQELVKRAFAGEDVVGDFEREKAQLEEDDDEKEIDNTLPGWGSWVGDGVSSKEKKRHTGRFVTKVDGVKKKDRKDFKLDRVIINEKRVKKNDKYLSSQLPHPFESRAQYERSLRLPVGPEWMTKETFQNSTKPRVILKPGIIAPMSKPTV